MGNLLQGLLKGVKVFFVDGAAGGHGMTAKTQQHTRMAFGHQVQGVAQVKARNRAA
jgi:hypothetical protein